MKSGNSVHGLYLGMWSWRASGSTSKCLVGAEGQSYSPDTDHGEGNAPVVVLTLFQRETKCGHAPLLKQAFPSPRLPPQSPPRSAISEYRRPSTRQIDRLGTEETARILDGAGNSDIDDSIADGVDSGTRADPQE